jgi:glycosyltransferase involved in cell wall biosynthesis
MGSARYLIFPSLLYETFGMTIVEAFAHGVPAIASDHGAAAELVRPDVNGLLFRPGDAAELANTIARAWADLPAARRMGMAARLDYESRYAGASNYEALVALYERAIRARDRVRR